MPALSPTMSAGNIAAWHVGVGDAVGPGSLLADVETDKATLGWESMEDGVVAAILVPPGARDIPVGTTVAVLVEAAGDVSAFADYKAEAMPAAAAAVQATATAATAAAAAPAGAPAAPSSSSPARRVGPAAARVLRQAGMASTGLAASGPRGALTKADALAAVARGGKEAPAATPPRPAAPAPAAAPRPAAAPASPTSAALPPPRHGMAYEDVPHTTVRRIIAARLGESKGTVPHAYLRGAAGTAAVQAARAALAASGIKASVNDFVIAAAARALADVPALNVRWDEGEGAAVAVDAIDVAIAVATPGGLITPIITHAASRSVPDIAAAVKDLAGRARANKLAPHEFQGGSFSISNLGMFGVTAFSAIINPPQAAILAVGATAHEPVWPAGADGVSFVDRLSVTLSFDARAVAAEDAAAWLDAFAAHLESPEGLIEGGGGLAAAA